MTCTLYTMQCNVFFNIILYGYWYIFLPGGTQTNPTPQASQLNQFFASTANSSRSSGERQNTKVPNFSILRSFILSRPARGKLKKRGILRERVFGCDLGEHLLNSGNEGSYTHHHTSSKGFACCWSHLSEKKVWSSATSRNAQAARFISTHG